MTSHLKSGPEPYACDASGYRSAALRERPAMRLSFLSTQTEVTADHHDEGQRT
jgi:hypothetical protein